MLNSRSRIKTEIAKSRNALDILFNSQLIIAFSSTSLAAESFILCDIPIDLRILGLIFFSTLMIYNLAHLRIVLKSSSDLLIGSDFNNLLFKISLVAILPFLINAEWIELLIFSLMAFASLAYVMPFVQNDSKVKGLRNVPILKNVFLAFIWATATVALPLTAKVSSEIVAHDILIFSQRFFFIFSLSLLFDIRDLAYDKYEGVQTIVKYAGIQKVKRIASISVLIFLVLTFIDQQFYFETLSYWPAFLISGILLLLFIRISDPRSPRWFYATIIDGSTIMQFMLLIATLLIL